MVNAPPCLRPVVDGITVCETDFSVSLNFSPISTHCPTWLSVDTTLTANLYSPVGTGPIV